MKKSRPQAAPRKLVLRREVITRLTSAQLDLVAGGLDDGGGCSEYRPQSCVHSDVVNGSCGGVL